MITSFVAHTILGAETLRTTQIKASPFVSRYRAVAISVVILLFVMETIVVILRAAVPSTTASATTATIAVYIIVSVTLTACYIVTTIAIMKRITEMSSARSDRVRSMTIRFLLSAVGYISTIIFEICSAILQGNPWGSIISYPLLFAAVNFTSLLQVLGLRPIGPHGRSATRSSNSSPLTDSTA